jgi:alcohol dehydrogenase
MKAMLYHGAHQQPTWSEVPDPVIDTDRDAIVQVDTVTLCGTDLHILRGDVPEVETGRVLGHEAVGTVVAAGRAVELEPGERVLVSCISGCGRCRFCRQGAYGQCRSGGGWVLGHTIDGVQAELVRVPYADLSCHRLPEQISDETAVLCADILPTSYEVGIRNGRVGPGDVVAIVGAGPIGLAAVLTAKLYSPGAIVVIDTVLSRLELAKQLGADVTVGGGADPRGVVDELTDGLGADVVIEAVGTPDAFGTCCTLVRPGGHLANIGVHGAPVTLPLQDLWSRNVTITTGLVDTDTTPLLLRLLASGQLDPTPLITHRFGLGEMEEAYRVFGDRASGALKVVCQR